MFASKLPNEAFPLTKKDELSLTQQPTTEEKCVTHFWNDNRIFGESEVLKKETYMSVKQVLKNRYSVWKKQVLKNRYSVWKKQVLENRYSVWEKQVLKNSCSCA